MDHSSHKEPKSSGSSMCMVESRESENYSQVDRSLIASHVWETCKPGTNFTVKTPTVSARRVQLMRAQLQSDRSRECEKEAEKEAQSTCGKAAARPATCQCGAKIINKNNSANNNAKKCDSGSSNSSDSDLDFACEEDDCDENEGAEEEEDGEGDCGY